jgi:peptide-methionine (R)-S-oxide reductase
MPQNLTRRTFFYQAASVAGGLGLWLADGGRTFAGTPTQVTIIQFSESGQRKGSVKLNKIVKSDAEWKKQLPPLSFEVTRHEATETAFSGPYWNLHDKGIYRCICCDTAAFNSNTKFESGTGWPSFWQPIAKENVREGEDHSLGMDRIAVTCSLCAAHLGHVFDDGPNPTGLRYCMNSASLHFVKLA